MCRSLMRTRRVQAQVPDDADFSILPSSNVEDEESTRSSARQSCEVSLLHPSHPSAPAHLIAYRLLTRRRRRSYWRTRSKPRQNYHLRLAVKLRKTSPP